MTPEQEITFTTANHLYKSLQRKLKVKPRVQMVDTDTIQIYVRFTPNCDFTYTLTDVPSKMHKGLDLNNLTTKIVSYMKKRVLNELFN